MVNVTICVWWQLNIILLVRQVNDLRFMTGIVEVVFMNRICVLSQKMQPTSIPVPYIGLSVLEYPSLTACQNAFSPDPLYN